MGFINALEQCSNTNNSFVCVGLDPNPGRYPAPLQNSPGRLLEFCKSIVDATHDKVCAYKPQISYFAAQRGEAQLEELIGYIKSEYPGVPVILDAKRGDIGATAEQYAAEAFERYGADAVTVNPYMGFDAIEPFLNYSERGVVILCRTSNPGGQDFQELLVDGKPLYQQVARTVSEQWNGHGNCLLVVGATAPEQMREVRALVGDMPFLVPGVGAQGGDLPALWAAGRDSNGAGLIINSSRGILYASGGDDFADAARAATDSLRQQINSVRE